MCEVFSEVNPGKSFVRVWERDEYDKAYIIMQRFGERANIMSNDAAICGMVDGFIAEHRTIQQSIVRMFCQMLMRWIVVGERDSHTDPRNSEGGSLLCK